MEMTFGALLDELLVEITRREPAYFARFGVTVPDVDRQVARYRADCLFEAIPEGDIAAALDAGIRHLRGRGVAVADTGEPDRLGAILVDGIADAFAADRGLVALRPGGAERALSDVLSSDYDEKRTEDGVRYFARRSGSRPLVLVNACGIPLTLWSRFLGDEDHDFRVLVVESRGQDALEGGIRRDCDLSSDAADILAALEHEGGGPADLLAWCDGGRLGIELARLRPDRFRKLVLLSASLRGTRALVQAQTAYESNFEKVITTLTQRPNLAPMFAKMLGEQLVSTDWDGLSNDAAGRAEALLRLPAKERESSIRVPMSRDLFLLNHARRIQSDAAYPVDDGIRALSLPVLLITGDHDHIANNSVARAALAASAQGGIHAEIAGAGHYCFDLQYPYFKLLLNAFLIDGCRPPSTARLRVADLRAVKQ